MAKSEYFVSNDSLHILDIPKNVGQYKVNDYLCFHFPTKPNAWHRFWTRVLLGWVWVDVSR